MASSGDASQGYQPLMALPGQKRRITMILLNAGNIWTDEYLNKVIELNEQYSDIKVGSLFGSISKLTPTARSADRIPYRDWAFIDRYIARAQENNISIRYTLNQSCIGSIQDFKESWDTKLKDDLTELHNMGVHEWIITSPLLMQLVRSIFPGDFLEVSTIAEVSTPEDAVRWLGMGADGVNISTSVNRNFPRIKGIIDTGIVVSILANEACLFRCPWRRECYNLSSHDSFRSEELFGFYPFRNCNEVRLEYPDEWIKARLVLPQWMKVYQEKLSVSWFKIAYRTHPYEVAVPMLEAYMDQDFKGNLCDLWPTISHLGSTKEPREVTHISCKKLDEEGALDWFISEWEHCDNVECAACGHCYELYEKAKCQEPT